MVFYRAYLLRQLAAYLAECVGLLTDLVSDKEIFYTQQDDW